ncbi:MAG: hypothetical protein EOM25_01040 [Deltaproteobacteria bacterium]|nr:hypothetical protein [Deltaproteobacteria bacterium]
MEEKPRELLSGVFSTEAVAKVGTGTTVRKTVQKTYWFVKEIEDGNVEVQPLNVNYVPSGPKQLVPKDDFLDKFAPEPEFYTQTVYPKMRELTKTIAKADRHRTRGESFSAEFEYNNAIKVDEENIRANFGLGLTYLDRGETNKGNDIFNRLVHLDAAFEAEHKHLFNEFGIKLRKNKMIEQALEYYSRASELAPHDENLHYNMARAHFAQDDVPKTIDHLLQALKLNPELKEARQFVAYLQKHNLVPKDYKKALELLDQAKE